jgi:hypothetical protein
MKPRTRRSRKGFGTSKTEETGLRSQIKIEI